MCKRAANVAYQRANYARSLALGEEAREIARAVAVHCSKPLHATHPSVFLLYSVAQAGAVRATSMGECWAVYQDEHWQFTGNLEVRWCGMHVRACV